MSSSALPKRRLALIIVLVGSVLLSVFALRLWFAELSANSSSDEPSKVTLGKPSPTLSDTLLPPEAQMLDGEPVDPIAASMPTALAGTNMPQLPVDEDGNLLVNAELRLFIEYFRSVPNADLAQAQALLDAYLAELPLPLQEQFVDVYERYQQYSEGHSQYHEYYQSTELHQAMQAVMQGDVSNESHQLLIQDFFAQMKTLRRSHFSEAEVSQFFGGEELMEQHMSQSLDIAFNKLLTPEEKRQQVIELEQQLPGKLGENVRSSRRMASITDDIIRWRQAGQTNEQIREALSQQHGAEFADRWYSASQ